MTRKRADKNQPEIVKALRDVGATVQHLHTVGQGCPDLLVGYKNRNYFIEVKTMKDLPKNFCGVPGWEALNDREREWHGHWAGTSLVVFTAEEALYEIGATK
jgi:hypothetical protein